MKNRKAASQRTAKWINMLKNFPEMTFEVVRDCKIRPARELAEAEKRLANAAVKQQKNRLANIYATYSSLMSCQAEVVEVVETNRPQTDTEGGFHDPVFEYEESIYLSPSFNAEEW
jgi:hypothetical protein